MFRNGWEEEIFTLSEVGETATEIEKEPEIDLPVHRLVEILDNNAKFPCFIVESKGPCGIPTMMTTQYVCNKIVYTKSRGCWSAYIKCRNRETAKKSRCSSTGVLNIFDPELITLTVTDVVGTDSTLKQKEK